MTPARHPLSRLLIVLLAAVPVTLLAQPGRSFRTGPSWEIGLGYCAAGDVNGDGFPDLVDTSGDIYLNDGYGAFAVGATLPNAPVGGYSRLADLDQDGHLDVVMLLRATSSTDSVRFVFYHNDGRATFTEITRIGVGKTGNNFLVADFNGDHYPDLAFIGPDSVGAATASLVMRFNNGAGTAFGGYRRPLAGTGWELLAPADFNRDGATDLLLNHWLPPFMSLLSNELTVWLNDSVGHFQPYFTRDRGWQGVDYGSRQAVVADFNGDQYPDIASFGLRQGVTFPDTTTRVEIFFNDQTGAFGDPYRPAAFNYHVDVEKSLGVGDFNGDGAADLAVQAGPAMQIWQNAGGGQLVAGPSLQAPTSPPLMLLNLMPVDVDADADPDLVGVGIDGGLSLTPYAFVVFNESPLGLPAPASASPLNLWPNPARGRVTLTAATPSVEASPVQVLDAVGRTVLTASLTPQTAALELPLAGLAPGVYTVRVGTAARRLVVE